MRPIVQSAMQTSSALTRMARRAELKAKAQAKKNKSKSKAQDPPPQPPSPPSSPEEKHGGHPKEFLTTPSSAPRRLNDVVRAPPELKRLPRGAGTQSQNAAAGKRDGILSMSQKAMMEKERDRAILRYREMKERKRGTGLDAESLAER